MFQRRLQYGLHSEIADILLRDLGSIDAAKTYASKVARNATLNGNLEMAGVYQGAFDLLRIKTLPQGI